MASETKEKEERSFDTDAIQAFLKEKDEVAGWIDQIDGATKTIQHLLDESKQAFDPEKDQEISRNLKRCTATASGFAKKAKVMLMLCRCGSLVREDGARRMLELELRPGFP